MPKIPSSSQRGFYIIGLLIVLAIIFFLVGRQMGGPTEQAQQVVTAQSRIDRSEEITCGANRQSFSQNITMWQINHGGEKATLEKLQRDRVAIPRCPGGGEYSIGPDGKTIYCSLHAPPPGTAAPNPAGPAAQQTP